MFRPKNSESLWVFVVSPSLRANALRKSIGFTFKIYQNLITSHHLLCYRSGPSYHHLLPRLIKLSPNRAPCLHPSNIAVTTILLNVRQIISHFCSKSSVTPFHPEKKPVPVQWTVGPCHLASTPPHSSPGPAPSIRPYSCFGSAGRLSVSWSHLPELFL